MSYFKRIPREIRQLPETSDAWHHEHADRLDRLEAAKPPPTVSSISPPSTAVSPEPQPPVSPTLLPVGYFRPALLFLTVGVVTGKITVEQAKAILSLLFGLPG